MLFENTLIKMKALFKAIRDSDLDKVVSIIEQNPLLVNVIAKQPPKKDDGQLPLQIAFKTGNFQIADYLIDNGADVNFIEVESVNEWRAPVIHDAIRASVFSSRYHIDDTSRNRKEVFDEAFSSLKKLVAAGADVKATDSYGNNCLMRAALDSSQLPLNKNSAILMEDLSLIFKLLITAGADINESNGSRQSVVKQFEGKPVAQFFI